MLQEPLREPCSQSYTAETEDIPIMPGCLLSIAGTARGCRGMFPSIAAQLGTFTSDKICRRFPAAAAREPDGMANFMVVGIEEEDTAKAAGRKNRGVLNKSICL